MNILFVCTGHTCRSPMAAAILRSSTTLPIQIQLAGTHATPGDALSFQLGFQHLQAIETRVQPSRFQQFFMAATFD